MITTPLFRKYFSLRYADFFLLYIRHINSITVGAILNLLNADRVRSITLINLALVVAACLLYIISAIIMRPSILMFFVSVTFTSIPFIFFYIFSRPFLSGTRQGWFGWTGGLLYFLLMAYATIGAVRLSMSEGISIPSNSLLLLSLALTISCGAGLSSLVLLVIRRL